MPALEKLHVQGFKSIRDQEIEFRALNVLIGANGSGKSNLLEVFHLLNRIVDARLQLYVGQAGGADALLHFGRDVTKEIQIRVTSGTYEYSCQLVSTTKDALVFQSEIAREDGEGTPQIFDSFTPGQKESSYIQPPVTDAFEHHVSDLTKGLFSGFRTYHFHDTSDSAKVKLTGDIEDSHHLHEDARNLAAFLYRLRERERPHYDSIVRTVRLAAPFFDDFVLQPSALNPGKIILQWRDKGSNMDFYASALSDGTLRFICLTTLLLQPDLPRLIILDEPELGLHPYAINLLVDLLYSAATRTQVVVSTQSVTLVDQLEPEDILVVDRKGDESIFRRLHGEEIASWLEDYSLGELWEKNILGGRPGR